jgi:uncharacterized phage-associated protein
MLPQFTFDERVAVEAILYILAKTKDPTFHHIAKLLYFADLCHLERYGTFICGDQYIAMKHGPVPSGVYDMLKDQREDVSYLRFPIAEGAFEVIDQHAVRALRAPDLEWLSDSHLECLDESMDKYDELDFATLTRLSHQGAWQLADLNDSISIEAILDQLGNPPDLIEYLLDPHP